jgi:hypothetical protein
MMWLRMHPVPFLQFAAENGSHGGRNFGRPRAVVMIKKVMGGYEVVCSKGRNLGGPFKTLKMAKKRLPQVEFFKHRST